MEYVLPIPLHTTSDGEPMAAVVVNTPGGVTAALSEHIELIYDLDTHLWEARVLITGDASTGWSDSANGAIIAAFCEWLGLDATIRTKPADE